nr:hypothetical protein [Tanacetum cinerariifolium]
MGTYTASGNSLLAVGMPCAFYSQQKRLSVVLEKGISDHRLILLKGSSVDYGPTPSLFFHSWLKMEGVLLISPEQSAFVKGRNIFGYPFILNEVMAWYRKHKKQLLVFKIDFEKAFDSLRWDFLDLVMENISFGLKWRSWIHGCLCNARSSVLVNGSPTTEFELFRGLRQGATFGRNNMIISHLMYADDVIFFGEWSSTNANNLICRLRCFFLIYGLKLNVHKCNVLGVCIFDEDVSDMANVIGCEVLAIRGATLTSVHNLKLKGTDLISICSRMIRNGDSTRFWDDIWIGDQSLKSKFPCIILLDNDQDCYVVNRVPIHDWSDVLRRHPRGGIDVGSFLCPIYQEDVESDNHIFFSCEMAKALWDSFAKWWELDIPFCDSIFDCFTWLDSLKVSNKVRSFIDGVGGRLCGLY